MDILDRHRNIYTHRLEEDKKTRSRLADARQDKMLSGVKGQKDRHCASSVSSVLTTVHLCLFFMSFPPSPPYFHLYPFQTHSKRITLPFSLSVPQIPFSVVYRIISTLHFLLKYPSRRVTPTSSSSWSNYLASAYWMTHFTERRGKYKEWPATEE